MVVGIGSTQQEAVAYVRSVMARVDETASTLQARQEVLPADRIMTSWTGPIEVTTQSSTPATRARGGVVLGAAGAMATALCAIALDKARRRTRPHGRRVTPRGGAT
ncbi:hypothetical protein CGQ25_04855 [Sinomonas sp. R1AF57]|nr:hypothetical protein CGQ25_04855 [Sinomonas sp. R1AF57]